MLQPKMMTDEVGLLRRRLASAEAALEAMRNGMVDAVVAEGNGIQGLPGAERIYQTFFQSMYESGLTLDRGLRIWHCNPRFCQLVGRSIEEIRGQSLVGWLAASERRRVSAALSSQPSGALETVIVGAATPHPVQLSWTGMSLEGRHYLCVVMTDLSKRVEIETALRISEERLALVLRGTNDAAWDWDMQDDSIYYSPRWWEMLGYQVDEVPPTAELWRNLIHPDDLSRVRERFSSAVEGSGSGFELEYRLLRKDHAVLYVLSRIFISRDSSGTAIRLSGTNCDVTLRRRAEEELRASRDHLEDLVDQRTRSLEAAKARAEKADQAKSSFLANMSHEIRTPINAILGLTHLLKQNSTLRQRRQLDQIGGAGKHLIAIVNDILDLAKIDSGKVTLADNDFALSHVFEQVCVMIAPGAAAKGLLVETDFLGVPKWLRGDEMRLVQSLLNFAANAVKFTERGKITLSATSDPSIDGSLLLRFAVTDTGVGIAGAEQQLLFRDFQQIEHHHGTPSGGTGLGLAITMRLARLMGGDAGVDSRLGRGSCFWFTARLKIGRAPDFSAAPAKERDAAELLHRYFAGSKVLLAEDNEINREIAVFVLETMGLEVDTAIDGVQALQKAENQRYDIILMDVRMPNMDGLEATRKIRQLANCQTIPILALTANAFDEDRHACIEAGMSDFLCKPVEPELLGEKLLSLLSGARV